MKKILILTFISVLLLSTLSFATNEQEVQTIETIQTITSQNIITKAKVIDTKRVYDRTIENLVDKVQEVTIEITEGEYKGITFDAIYVLSYDLDNKIMAYELEKGNKVNVQLTIENNDIINVEVQDVIRQDYIIWMIALFFISILVIGKKQGIKAIAGLVVTILAIYFIMITSIYKGYSPIIMSILTSALIIIVTFIIIAGLNKKAFTAAIGTTGGVVFAGAIAFGFGILAKLSGGQEEAIMLSMNSGDIIFNFRELLFAGIVVASLGACMDVRNEYCISTR